MNTDLKMDFGDYFDLCPGSLIARLLDDPAFVERLKVLADRGVCPHIILWALDAGVPHVFVQDEAGHVAPFTATVDPAQRPSRAKQKPPTSNRSNESVTEAVIRLRERDRQRTAALESFQALKSRPRTLDDLQRVGKRPDPRSTDNHEADRRMILILEWLLEKSASDVFPDIAGLIVEAYRVAGLPPKDRNAEHARVRKVSSLATVNEFPRVAVKRESYAAFTEFAIDFLPSPHRCVVPTPPTGPTT